MMTFIYGLLDPRNNELRYIGKTDNPKARLGKHIREAKKSTVLHRHAWIRSLLNIGLLPKLVLLMQVSDYNWQYVERLLIISLRDSGYSLTNMADGGIGGVTGRGQKRSDEFKARMSVVHRQRFIDDSSLREEAKQRTKQVWSSEEFRIKRDAIINSPEVKAKMSKFQKERWNNPEIRQRQGEVGKRNWQNPEIVKRIREGITQKWQDPEYRKKMSEIRKEDWKNRDREAIGKKVSEKMKGRKPSDEQRKKMSFSRRMFLVRDDILELRQLQAEYFLSFGYYNKKYDHYFC